MASLINLNILPLLGFRKKSFLSLRPHTIYALIVDQ